VTARSIERKWSSIARRAAEGVTTRAIKERLDRLARDFDRLADAPMLLTPLHKRRAGSPR